MADKPKRRASYGIECKRRPSVATTADGGKRSRGVVRSTRTTPRTSTSTSTSPGHSAMYPSTRTSSPATTPPTNSSAWPHTGATSPPSNPMQSRLRHPSASLSCPSPPCPIPQYSPTPTTPTSPSARCLTPFMHRNPSLPRTSSRPSRPYANPLMLPGAFPMLLQPGGSRPIFHTDSRGPPSDLPLPMPPQLNSSRSSPGPFRGGGPPTPVVLDDNRVPSHTPLAPMDVDRISHPSRKHSASYPPSSRDSGPRGPAGQSLLLHHPVPSQSPVDGMRQSRHEHARPLRMPSPSASPPPHAHLRARSPQHLPPFKRVVGPGQTPGPVSRRTPPLPYSRDERESGWDRRIVPIPIDHAEWERERRGHPPSEYPVHTSPAYYASRLHSPRGPSPRSPRERSPDVSPRAVHPTYRPFWEKPPTSGPGVPRLPLHPPMDMHEPMRRYDSRFDARETPNQYERERGRERERERERESMVVLDPRDPRYVPSPDVRARGLPPPGHCAYESPQIPLQTVSVGPAEPKERRRRTGKERDAESSAGSTSAPAADPPPKERKRRVNAIRVKEEPQRGDNPAGPLSFKYRKTVGSPEPASAGSGRSVQPSPTGSAHLPPVRVVDEDYDEGVADALMGLSQYPRAFGPGRAPGASPRTSISSRSPPVGTKRPLSPALTDEHADKRSRVGSISGRPTSHSISSNSNGNSGGRPTPTPSMRTSPIPFHQQPSSHSPETRQTLDRPSYPPSPSLPPSLPMMLPPHPRPIGAGLSHAPPMTLPPLAHPPAPAVVSPQRDRDADGDERMHSRSASPPRGAKRDIVPHGTSVPASASGSPSAKATPLPASSNGRAGPIP
ncbi:hypothetical protein SCP_0607990 [Sparassis crispa]|uniref:Uncharacterized protein n=1 Tax=Sparassis crispa TaxID=139825 RepID=A0A401GRM8_9APHY|nr:hypothetical protein SCP_0607990 [Sparassis crispa]GBE84819.1 hypothetical protein SCP_0607990 [Sparassis crispa]